MYKRAFSVFSLTIKVVVTSRFVKFPQFLNMLINITFTKFPKMEQNNIEIMIKNSKINLREINGEKMLGIQ